MNGYLIAEEGPLLGMVIHLDEESETKEWTLGRTSDVDIMLEDPMVSRKHVVIRLTPEGFVLENLSSVNPATQNGKIIVDPILLHEGDILQIGNTFFRFTERSPEEQQAESVQEEQAAAEREAPFSFASTPETRWLLKVISGPNSGAEFGMQKGATYLIGKDPNICDIVFQDLSVSRQHARLTVDEEEKVFIEDLGSRNGVLVNGEIITDKHQLSSQDMVALGTTTFLVVDREQARETIVSPPVPMVAAAKPIEEKAAKAPLAVPRDWKEMVIPKKHLIFAGIFAFLLLISFIATVSLFKAEPIVVKEIDDSVKIKEIIDHYPAVQFTFTQASGKLFLVGHVLTQVDKQELLYLIKQQPFVNEIEDNVIIDELVWQNMNALLAINPDWMGVSVYAPTPGKFVLKGYLKTLEESEALSDYINLNFPYLDRIENQVVVENNLTTEIQSLLTDKQFPGITFQLSNGEVVLSGRAEEKQTHSFNEFLHHLKVLPGVRIVKNYVVMTTEDTSRVDLTGNYQITGFSKQDDRDYFVVINGRILGKGDLLDGMKISQVKSNHVLLEKDGLKYRINYNLQ